MIILTIAALFAVLKRQHNPTAAGKLVSLRAIGEWCGSTSDPVVANLRSNTHVATGIPVQSQSHLVVIALILRNIKTAAVIPEPLKSHSRYPSVIYLVEKMIVDAIRTEPAPIVRVYRKPPSPQGQRIVIAKIVLHHVGESICECPFKAERLDEIIDPQHSVILQNVALSSAIEIVVYVGFVRQCKGEAGQYSLIVIGVGETGIHPGCPANIEG